MMLNLSVEYWSMTMTLSTLHPSRPLYRRPWETFVGWDDLPDPAHASEALGPLWLHATAATTMRSTATRSAGGASA